MYASGLEASDLEAMYAEWLSTTPWSNRKDEWCASHRDLYRHGAEAFLGWLLKRKLGVEKLPPWAGEYEPDV